ncbi:MAG: DUF3322 domain-containing protein [Salinisphaera sp.]|nr:DUF3322 domain-containing protein [Salinisphaera sp.]
MSWSNPEDLKRQVQRLWDRGEILRAGLTGEALFPRRLPLKKPSPADVADRFGEVQDWIKQLREASFDGRGFGYEIAWKTVRHRIHGANRVPDAVVVPNQQAALALIGKTADAKTFDELARVTLARFPALSPWLMQRPLTVLEQASNWRRLLDVVAWFTAHPRPGLYLRELDIPGIYSKFIEARRKLLAELLDRVLPADAIDATATGARGFERRYGLRSKPPLIRFRILEPRLHINGLSDLSVPPAQFRQLAPPVARVFITENEINGLAFPDVPDSLVIFGLGYGLDRLANIEWLQRTEIHYWGDIDSHGFAMLHRLRTMFPQARSLLMDRATLQAHRHLWGQEPGHSRFEGSLSTLNDVEQALFDDLKENRLAQRLRLEQERIAYGWVQQALARRVAP